MRDLENLKDKIRAGFCEIDNQWQPTHEPGHARRGAFARRWRYASGKPTRPRVDY